MGISFKVAKNGTRFQPRTPHQEISVDESTVVENSKETSQVLAGNESSAVKRKQETDVNVGSEDGGGSSVSSTIADYEVSFTLNLFPNGFTIGKPTEKGKPQPLVQDVPKSLHPYDRTSETLFSAIESGRLPGDILDDIPGKYFDGTIVCEVRDYRKCVSEAGNTVAAVDKFPFANKVHLRMSLENVVKDIPSISDDSWTYSDLMEVESRIVKALQPQLCLDPTPKMDRLCSTQVSNKLDLGICSGRRKRLRQAAEVTIMSNNQMHWKKISIEKVPENVNCYSGDSGPISADAATQHFRDNAAMQHAASGIMPGLRPKMFGQEGPRAALPLSSQPKFHSGISYPRTINERGPAYPANASNFNATSISTSGPDLINSYTDTVNGSISPLQAKRENQDGQIQPMPGIQRPKQAPMGLDSTQQQPAGPPLDSIHGADLAWKNSIFHQQQSDARGIQYANMTGQKYAPQVMNDARQAVLQGAPNHDAAVSFYLEQTGMMRYNIKEERIETEQKSNSQMLGPEGNQLDRQQLQMQRQPQHQFMRSHFPAQTPWQNLGQLPEKDPRKEDVAQKRKSIQSPRVSSGPLVQSPVSSKSGEISSGSFGAQFGTVATASTVVSQKEKVTGVPTTATVGTTSVASSPNNSMQQQHQVSAAAKRRSNSLPKTPAVSGVGSPASVSNMNVPLNASSPSVGTPPVSDQAILERFSKIDMLTQRYQLNCKKNKVDDYPITKPTTHSAQEMAICLASVMNIDDLKDATNTKLMSKSLIGGSMNICKRRVLSFLQSAHPGNGVYIAKPQNKLILLERPADGMVAMQHGDIEEIDSIAMTILDHGPRLPNTNYADLFAAQFSSLMEKEGYQLSQDEIYPITSTTGLSAVPGISDMAATDFQYQENITGQPSASIAPANSSGPPMNSSQNLLPGQRMLPPGNNQGPQMPQGYLAGASMPARPQQLEHTSLLQQPQNQQSQIQQQQQQQQQQHPHPQMQRTSLLHASNPLSRLNAIGQNPNLQMGNPMINKAPHLQQLQMLQQQPQQQQQMQRKMMMGLGAAAMGMGSMGSNMVGLGSLSNVVGMGGVRSMGPGISAPMGPMSGLSNMGQSPMNPTQMINQLRPGQLTPAQAALMVSKIRNRTNMTNMLGQSSIGGMSGNNQMHAGSSGLSMVGQNLNRANMSSLQQRAAMASMGPPKANFYLNQQTQLQFQHQQLQQQQQQISSPLQQQQMQQQQISSPLQHPQAGSPSAMAIQQQLGQQQPQISPPQAGQQNPMSPQLSSGALQQMNASNTGAGPASPQLSSQTHGSVGSISSSPMELQGVNKGNSINNI